MDRVGQALAPKRQGSTDALARSPDRRSLREVIDAALRRLPDAEQGAGYSLDLSGLPPSELKLFTAPEAEKLKKLGPITRVVMPPDTDRLPSGIDALRDLQRLEFPGFTGTYLDLRERQLGRTASNRALWISTPNARALREIRVDSNRQAIANLRFDLGTLHTRKVVLVDPTHRRPIPGRTYDRELMGRGARDSKKADDRYEILKNLNLNFKVPLPDGQGEERAVCRHLALAHLLDRIEHRRTMAEEPHGEHARLDSSALSDAVQLEKALPEGLERAFCEITSRTNENHLVSVSRWHDFLHARFMVMVRNEVRQFLVLSPNHAMHMELQAKCRDEKTNDIDWVVTFYDPNRTAMPSRTLLDRRNGRQCELKEMLPNPESLETYFGSTPNSASAWVMGVDEADLRTESRRQSAAKRHEDYRFAAAQFTPWALHGLVQFRLRDGLVRHLKQTIGDLTINGQMLANKLQAKDEAGVPVLSRALRTGHAQATQALLDAVLEAAAAKRISPSQLTNLLQAKAEDGAPVLYIIMEDGLAQAAKQLLGAILQVAATKFINQTQLMKLLQAESTASIPALSMAMQKGHAQAARELLDAMLKAAAAGHIDPTDLAELLRAEGDDGTWAHSIARQEGHVQAAQLLELAVLEAERAGLINAGDALLREAELPLTRQTYPPSPWTGRMR